MSDRLGWLFYYIGRSLAFIFSKVYFRFTIQAAWGVPRRGAFILAANHGSFFDPLWLSLVTRRRIRFLMYAPYYSGYFWARPLLDLLGVIPIGPGTVHSALKESIATLHKGGVIGIFPEGQVSSNGEVQEIRSGVFLLSGRSGAPIVPVGIRGNANAFGRHALYPVPRRVTAVIGRGFLTKSTAKRSAGTRQFNVDATLGIKAALNNN